MPNIVKITDALGRKFTAHLPYSVASPGGDDPPGTVFHILTLGGHDITLNNEPLTLGV